MTLVELLIATSTASVVFAAIGTFSLFAAKSFVAIGNYDDLDRNSRAALDRMIRDIRQTRSVVQFQTNRLELVDYDQNNLTFIWNPSTKEVRRQKRIGVTLTEDSLLLAGCDYLSFGIYQRNPSNNFQFYPATNNITGSFDINMCKLVDVSWKCSRQIFGQSANTESIQTAKIAMRN